MITQFKSLISYSKILFFLYLSTSTQMVQEDKATYARTPVSKEKGLNPEQNNIFSVNSYQCSPFLNQFYRESVCELYEKEGENLLEFASQKQWKQESLVEKINETMKFSPAFLKKYKADTLYLQEVRKNTEQLLLAMTKNRDSYCQLESLLSKDNDKFEIVLCLSGELNYHSREGERVFAQYDHTIDAHPNPVILNRIRLAPELWTTQKLDFRKATETIDHEVCHAFTAYQNLKKGALIPLPCNVTLSENKEELNADCKELFDIYKSYQLRLQKLINIFFTPIHPMSYKEQKIFEEFSLLTKNYKPRCYEVALPEEFINRLKREGKLKDNFELTSKPIYG